MVIWTIVCSTDQKFKGRLSTLRTLVYYNNQVEDATLETDFYSNCEVYYRS